MTKPVIYSELDSVGNDFLSIQDALMNGEKVDPSLFSCIYNQWLVEYDQDGFVYVTQLDSSGKMPTDSPYWDERTVEFDCTDCYSEDELYILFNQEIKPLLKR